MSTSYWKRYGKKLISIHGNYCYYCGEELVEPREIDPNFDFCGKDVRMMATVDHVIPRSKGGKTNMDNLVPCCFTCNATKRDR